MNTCIIKVNGLVIGEVTDWEPAKVPEECVELADVPAAEYVPGNYTCRMHFPATTPAPETRLARACWWEDDTFWVEYEDGAVEGYEKAMITDLKWELHHEKGDGTKPSSGDAEPEADPVGEDQAGG